MTRALWRDTTPDAERVYLDALRAMPPATRLSAAHEMIVTAHLLMAAGLRHRHPHLAQGAQHAHLLALWLGPETAARLNATQDAWSEHTEGGAGLEAGAWTSRNGETRMDTPLDALLAVTEALDLLGVPYLLGGSWASMAHGVPRATQDADLLAQLNLAHVAPLVAALRATFYIAPEAMDDAIRRSASFNVIPLGLAFKVDIFVAPDRPYERTEMARRAPLTITQHPPRTIYVATPEDVVLTKLRWYQQGNSVSEQQWSDILGVLRVQGATLDQAYLRRWADTLGVAALLATAVGQAGAP